jgi:hypothetical protein
MGHGLGFGRLDDLGERAVVVPVPVRGDDGAHPALADQVQQVLGLVGGVDQQLLPGGRAAEQVGVVGHLADGQLRDRQAGQLPHVGGAAHLDVARVAHRGLRSLSVSGRRYGRRHGR